MQRLRERRGGAGLGEARRPLDQHVAVGEQADEQALQHIFLADDRAAERGHQPVDERALLLHARIDFRNIERHGGPDPSEKSREVRHPIAQNPDRKQAKAVQRRAVASGKPAARRQIGARALTAVASVPSSR